MHVIEKKTAMFRETTLFVRHAMIKEGRIALSKKTYSRKHILPIEDKICESSDECFDIVKTIKPQGRPYVMKLACRETNPDIAMFIYHDKNNTKDIRQRMVDEIIDADDFFIFSRLNIKPEPQYFIRAIKKDSKLIFKQMLDSSECNNINLQSMLSMAINMNRKDIVTFLVHDLIMPTPRDIAKIVDSNNVELLEAILNIVDITIDEAVCSTIKSIEMYELLQKHKFTIEYLP